MSVFFLSRCGIAFRECERKGWGKNMLNLTMRRNADMNRYTGKWERQKIWKGGDNSSDTNKLRANCSESHVLRGEVWFSLDNKEAWTDCIIWGERKIADPSFFSSSSASTYVFRGQFRFKSITDSIQSIKDGAERKLNKPTLLPLMIF